MKKEIAHKVGALHLRLLDEEEQYAQLLAHLVDYCKDNEAYTNDVLTALEDGLDNFFRYKKLDNALSPRYIKIEKRKSQRLRANDTEGAYHIVLSFDDGKESVVHFKRKQDQLLYMLIVLSSLKSGYSAEFLRRGPGYDRVKAIVEKLIMLVYPSISKRGISDIMMGLAQEVGFTDTVQKMRSAVKSLLKSDREQQEERWFMPYTLNIDRKRVYQMHMEPTKILYPEEFQAIIDELPFVDDYVDMSRHISDEMLREENEKMLNAAHQGDVAAMNQLAYTYNYGIGRKVDQDKAFSLWKETADMGNAEGQYYVGVFYGTGDVVTQDYAVSTQYFQKAAQQGHADAIWVLGLYRIHGFGCDADLPKALALFKRAAERGSADAANEVGYIYDRGKHGVRKDEKEAFKWFKMAAEKGHTEAIRYVIRAYHDGLVDDPDGQQYLYWVKRGLELDVPEVSLQVGYYLYQDKKYEKAFDLIDVASETGLLSANHILAIMLVQGLGVEKNIERAIQYLTDGARNNDETCLDLLKKVRPKIWEEVTSTLEDVVDMRSELIILVGKMEPEGNQRYFLELIDRYRENFHEDYMKEINRQFSIHRPSTDKDHTSRRKIVVRKSSSRKAKYEIVITLANGMERILKLNPNSLVLVLLTIICSFKSGYTTVMALHPTCRQVMGRLASLVLGKMSEAAAKDYALEYMTSPRNGSDSYKMYSNLAKRSIRDAIAEYDDAIHFLFDNRETIGRHPLRSMNIDANDIELPRELAELANAMPDGKNILYSLEDERVE